MIRNWESCLPAVCLALAIFSGCGPAYLGPPPPMQQPPARLSPLPQQSPLMLPATPDTGSRNRTFQDVPNVPADQIFVPPKSSGSARYHQVAPGETFSDIVRKLGTTPEKLKRANSWDNDPALRPGDMILIP